MTDLSLISHATHIYLEEMILMTCKNLWFGMKISWKGICFVEPSADMKIGFYLCFSSLLEA